MPVNRFDRTYDDSPDPESGSSESPFDEQHTQGGPEALRRLQAQLGDLGDYARLYFAARKDAVLASVRKLALWAMAGIVGFAILCTMLITATVLGMLGLAQIVGIGLGDRPWAGYLIVGFGLLMLVAAGLTISIRLLQRRFRKQTVNKYAKRHPTQQARPGHDVPAGRTAERN